MNLRLSIIALLSTSTAVTGLTFGTPNQQQSSPPKLLQQHHPQQEHQQQHPRRKILQQGGAILSSFAGLSTLTTPANAASEQKPAEFNEVGQQETPPEGERPFVTLSNGVQIKDFRVGSGGGVVQSGSKVEVTLKGRLLNLNGVIFYDTKSNDPNGFGEGTPLQFTVGDGTVVPGLESGIVGMTKGGIRRIIVPTDVGYGKFPTLEPQPFSEMEKRALDSVVKNPRRDGTVLFDVKIERVR